jgi:ribosomal protein S16
MFKKLLAWIGIGAKHTETVREILTPPASVAETIKTAVNNQITDAVTAKPKSRNRRRKSKATKTSVATGKK